MTQPQFQWQPNVKILLFSLIFLPVTISLGFWQLQRAEQKQEILSLHGERKQAQPVAFANIDHQGDRQYLRVRVEGKLRSAPTLLLDNRVRQGKPGYEVLNILDTGAGPLLINRGWVVAGLSRQQLPEIAQLADSEKITLEGYLYQSPGKQVMLGEDLWDPKQPTVVIQNAAPDWVGERLGEHLYPYQLRLAGARDGLLPQWSVVNVQPEKHTGYAVQWFAMALALVILTLFANSNLAQVLRKQPADSGK